MDPVTDALEICRLSVAFEFPWDCTGALQPALYSELTERTQKRYDGTVLLLDAYEEARTSTGMPRAGGSPTPHST